MKLKNILIEYESFDKTILIRSKNDDSFRFDITYNNKNIIYKVETQGNTADKIHDKDWLNLFIKFTTRAKMDYGELRDILKRIPELYVKDIV